MKPPTRAQAIATLTALGQPYELHSVQVGDRLLRIFKQAPRSLRELYHSTASHLPFLAYEDDRSTFAEAWQAAARLAHVLVHECGVAHGDRVAIAMRNYPEWMLAFSAVTSIGAVAVALNALWQGDELAYGLHDCGAKVLLADAERLQRLRGRLPNMGLRAIAVRATRAEAGGETLDELCAGLGNVPMPPADIADDDMATIFYTSGSTGHPKGVVSTHRNIIAALLSWELDRRVAETVAGIEVPPPAMQPGTLLAVPLFHVTASHAVYLSSYRLQRRVFCMYRWDAQAAAAIIERERLSSFIAPAAMTGDLLRVAHDQRHDLSSLLSVGGGGAPRAPEQVRRIGTSFGQAMPNTGWGMTETNAIGTSIGGEDYLTHPASSGRCSQVLQLKVVDESGAEVAAGHSGELLVRGTSIFIGYWKRPELDTSIFDADGWFRTGDIARIDEDGFVYIVDRLKDLIIRGGENIGCGQVEAALLMHPDVHEAAVYAVPDERLGEEVGATVHGSEALDVDALREFLALHLARFEVPRYLVKSAAPLPRTPSGKILKRELKDAALASLREGSGKAPA